MRIAFALIAGSLMATSPAIAQDVNAEQQEQLRSCMLLESDAARLACFDGVMSQNEEVSEEVRAVQQAEARDNFGFSEEEQRERITSTRPERPDRFVPDEITIEARVADARNGPFNSVTILLDNGQIWRSTNAGNLRHTFKRGDQVTLREGAFTGYRLRVEGKSGMLGMERVQ